MDLLVFPVGCTEGKTTLYVDVAAVDKDGAKSVIETTRPRLSIIHIGEPTGSHETDKPRVIGVRPC